jgi:two-component system copper resistance phosphate regulon response regulator CusR
MSHSAMRILFLEDERALSRSLAGDLQTHGLEVASADAPPDFTGDWNAADVILLDRQVPLSGIELCRTLRRDGVNAPILMLAERDGVEDRVAGLEAGADDCISKPFAVKELVARIHALGRRRSLLQRVIRVADLEINLASKRAVRGGRSIELTAKEFALLECLAMHVDEVIDRERITKHVWDENHDSCTNVLEVLVGRLRRKIDNGFEPKLIHTMRSAGYRLGV